LFPFVLVIKIYKVKLNIENKFSKIFIAVILVGGFLSLTPKDTKASEGKIELRSTTGEDYKCLAVSLRMQNLEYRIPFSCRNLIYPAGENIFNYVMWATPTNGGNTLKLGALGLGKGEFKTKTSFSALFVTTESKKDVKAPVGTVVMEGDVESWEFLETQTSPTPTLTPAPDEEQNEEAKTDESKPEEQLTTRQKLVLALKRAGIAALFALVALIGIIFVVSRSRG